MPFLEKTGKRGLKFAGALCALAAWLLFGAAQRAPAATPSNVQYTAVSSVSVSASWELDAPAAETPFIVISTKSDFSVWLSSALGTLGQQSAAYSIADNTTYYFKVKVSTESDAAYSAYITTLTLAAVPAAVYFDEVSTISITAAAYAPPPAFANPGAGSSGMNIAIDTDTWTWSGWYGEKWTGKNAVPGTGRFVLAAAVVGGRIYAIGGYNPSWVAVATNEEYDPASNTWAAKTAMPTARCQPAAAAAGGKIYVIGGSPGTTVNEEYDPASNTWASKAAMPAACNYPTAAAVGGKIYVLGGDASPYNQTNEYNPATDSWASKTPAPSMYGGSAAAVVGGRIYIMGSQYTLNIRANDEYNPAANSWSTKAAMPTGRSGLAAAAVGGRIYAIGGADQAGTTAINDEYDPASNTWVSKTAMTTARKKLAAAAAGGRIYALGGQTAYTANEEYDPGRASRFAPLSPNTQYSFKAKARNAVGIETSESPVFSTWTLAAASFPQEISTFTDVFTSSLTVNWSSGTASGGYNGPGAQYLVEASSISSFATITASSLTYNVWAVLEGLNAVSNQTYSFRVKAANNAGVWGDYLVLGSTITGAIETPDNIYFDDVSTTSITASAYAPPPAFANLGVGSSGVNIAIDTDTWTWSGWRSGDKWTSKTALGAARYYLAAAAVGGKIYIVGGTGGAAGNDEYDPVANSRTAKTAMPTPREGLAAAAAGGRVYAIGMSWGGVNEEYDPLTNAWSSKAAMPTSRQYSAAAAAGGKIYALGGNAVSPYNQNEEYDPAANAWSAKTPMPTGRYGLAAAAAGGKIYAIGGYVNVSPYYTAANEEYDPAANSWVSKTAMPTSRKELAAATVGGRVYAIGGYTTVSVAANEEYDPAANTWSARTALPAARSRLAAASSGGRIYALGGYTTTGVATNEEYDPGRASRFAPLVPNTQYSFKAKARNAAGIETGESPPVSKYTLAAVSFPQEVSTFTEVFTSSLTVNWSSGTAAGGYNGPGARYLVQSSSVSSFASIMASSQTYNLQAVLEGLAPLSAGALYYFRVKAANNAGVWGDYLVLGSTMPGAAATPTAVYFDEVSTISITASAYAPPPAFANLNSGLSGINVAISTDTWTWSGWRGGDVWTAKTGLGAARYGLAAAAAGGRIYIIGGTGGTTANDEYDPVTNTRTAKTAMPTGRYWHAAAAAGGRIYALGGYTSPYNQNEEYDPASNTWATKTPMPSWRYYLAAAAAGGRIYALGGYDADKANEEYDPATNTWAAKTAMPTGRRYLAAAAVGGKIYVIGGNSGGTDTRATNEEYDPAADSWAGKTAMPTARYSHAAAAACGRIYVMGGTSGLAANEEYDPASNTWAVKAAMPTARYGLAAAAAGGRIYALGGYTTAGVATNEEYDPGLASRFAPLVPNTQYSFKAKARNAAGGETDESPVFSTWTLAAVSFPQSVSTFTEVFTSSLTVNWSSGTAAGGYNGPGAQYLAQASTDPFFYQVAASSLTYNLQAALEGLTGNLTWYFRVKAANNDGVWGDYLVLSSTVIGAAVMPAVIYFDEVSTISITASAYAPPPAFANLNMGLSGINIAIDTDTWTWSGWHGEKWTARTAMTTGRYWLAAAAAGGRVYAIGGWQGKQANEEYDPAANSWTTKTAMPTGRNRLAAAAVGGRIYAIGGVAGSAAAVNEEYDPAANTWAVKAAMPTARYELAAAAAGGRIYAVGGYTGAKNQNEEYDPATDTWAVKAAMPTPREGLAAAAAGGRIYALGGNVYPATKNEEYDPVVDAWTVKTSMPTARKYLAASALGGRIYAISGDVSPYNQNEEYDPAANSWITKTAMPTGRQQLAAAASGGRIYVLGGSLSPYNQNEEYDPGRASKFSPLVPNTQYSFKARARSVGGAETGDSAVFSTWTLAAVSFPQSVSTFTEVFTSSLTVNWSSGTAAGGYNGPGARYLVQSSSVSSFASIMASSQTYNLQAVLEGLAPLSAGALYYFRVKAANNAGVWGDYLVLGSTMPGAAATPTAVYFDEVSTISITASAYAPPPAFANLNSGLSGINVAISTDTWTWSGWRGGDVWTAKTLMITARQFLVAASVGGRIYAIGGQNGPNANEEYNPAANSWAAKTAMPTGRYEFAAAVAGGRIYAMGGWAGSSYFANNEEYDPVANTWAARAVMPTARKALAAAALGGRIYAIGSAGGTQNQNEEYDPAADSWVIKTAMQTKRYYTAAAEAGGKIYVLGGSLAPYNQNEVYDPATNTWAIKASMPVARQYIAAAALGGRIYAIGGSDDGTTVRNENEEYDPAADVWVTKPPMPTARSSLAAAAAGGRIYAIGGYNAGYLKTTEEYDPGRAAKFSPLIPNTQYSFKAKSRNADGAESGESAVFSTYTLAAAAGPQGVSTFTAVFTSSLTVNWSSGTASGGYNAPGAAYLVQASTSSSNFVPVAGSSQTGNIYADIAGLAANTTYYLRVRAANNGGVWGPYLTLGSTPTAAAVPGPAVPPFFQISSTAFTVRWAVNNPTGTLFACQISSEPSFVPVWATSNTYNSYAGFTGLYSNTTYYAKTAAKGRNNIFSDYYQIGSTVTLSTLVPGPVIYAVFSDSATVNWVPLPASPSSSTCQGYLVQASPDSFFSGNIYSSSTADSTLSTLTVTGLLSGVTYYFRVGSLNRLNVPNYALAGSTAMPGAATPRLVSPADGLYVTATNPVFMWAASVPDYQLQVADNTGFSPVLLDSATAAESVHSTVTLATGGIYYWRVRGGNQTSSWSPYFTVKIDTAPPQGSAYQSFSSSGGAMSEDQFNDLTAGVTAQLSVIDGVSGLDAGARELPPVPGTAGLWHMNEWQGAPADSSGWLNHSTYTTAAWTQGMFGGGLDFQGTRRASLPGAPSLDISGSSVTMQAWIKRTGDGAIVTKDNSYLMAVNSGKLQMGVETGAAGAWAWGGSTAVPSGVWTFVTCVYDGTNWKFYINGRLVETTAPAGSQTGNISPSGYALVIGNRASAALGFNGVIDEVRVLNTARTEAEVKADYMSYQAFVSTNAGASWQTVASTAAEVSPRVALSGPPYSTSPETLKALGMTLPVSTNALTCGGQPCGAMNQLKFVSADAAGNILEAGPYALLVSTFATPTGIYFDEVSTFSITASAYAPPPAFSGLNIGLSGINVARDGSYAGWRGGDKWTIRDLMVTARYGLAASAVGGKIYAIGGTGGTTINEEYDPAAGSWSPKTAMPTGRSYLAASASGGKIYAMGGSAYPYTQNEEYDPAANTWAVKAAMPAARQYFAAAAAGGRIYVLGGQTNPYNQNEEYDPAANTWTSKTVMPTGRYYLAAAAAGGKIYALGGHVSPYTQNEEYDPAVNTWVAKEAMPTGRQYFAAAALGGRIYAIGGYTGSANTAANEEYDPAANTWAAKAAMPTARQKFAASASGGRIYAVGGYTSIAVAANEEYDSGTAARFAGLLPNTQYTFKAKARNAAGYETGESPEVSTPTLAAVAAAQGSAFTGVFTSSLTVNWSSGTAVGGYNGPGAKYLVEASSAPGFAPVKASSLTYNLQAGLEGLTGSLTYYFRIKAANNAGVWGNYLVLGSTVMGLIETPTAVYFDEVSTVSITAAAYAPPPAFANLNVGLSGINMAIDTGAWAWTGWRNGDKWTVKTAMPTGRSSFAAAVAGGRIYAIGGFGGPAVNEEYDPAANTWASKTSMPTGRSYLAASASGGKIYALGGDASPYNQNEEYDPAANIWAAKAAMPTGRDRLAAAALGGRIYTIGGSGSPYTYNQNEEYDPAANAWITKAAMPTARYYLAAAALGGRIYVPGGYSSGSNPLAANEEYDPAANTWTAKAAMPTARYNHAVAAAGGRIYALGGYGTGNSNEEYDPGRASKFTGLAPNTQYSFKAKARNSVGVETDESPVFSTYTLAAVAGAQETSTFTDVFTSSLTVNWSSGTAAGGYNGPGAQYLVQASSVSSFVSIAASSLTYNLQAVLEGLTPLAANALYYFRVKAANNAVVWGDYFVLGSTLSGAAVTPTAVYFDEVSTTAITAAAYAPPPAFANLNAGLSGINVAISTDTWTWAGWRNGDVWTAKTAMSTKRYYLAAAAAGGKIYALGGYTGSVSLAANEEYDPAADAWASKAALPTKRYCLAAAAAGGRVYAVGGSGGTQKENEEYDPVSDTWVSKAAMPSARYSLAAAAAGGRIYAIGGNIGASNGIQTNEEYDPAADAWASRAAMPTGRSSLSAAAIGGRIYAIGGFTNGRVATNEEYDPAADSWVTKTAMPAPRDALAASALGGRIYAIGGNANGKVAANEEYDPAANAWITKAAMPAPRDALAAVAAGGRIYAIGGSTGSVTALNEEYDPGRASRFAPLVPNTQYSFKAKARNAAGAETAESPVFSTYTLAAVAGPQGVSTFTGVFISSLTVHWSSGAAPGGYNAPGAQYLVQASSVSSFAPIAASSLTYNLQAVLEGLTPLTANKPYYFRVKAANNGGVWGDYLVLGSTMTGAIETPAAIYFDEVSTTAITAAAYAPPPAFTGLDTGLSGINMAIDTNTWTWAGWRNGDVWTAKTAMPTARYSHVVASFGGKIYAMGGSNWPSSFAVNEEYDPAADSWVARTAMPAAASSFAAAAAAGKIYAMGLSGNWEYDPAADSWAVKTAMPAAASGPAAAAAAGKIYVVGSANQEYDPAADSWAVKTAMPTARSYLAAAAAGGKIYALGGQTSPYNQNQEYDPTSNSWVSKTAMPTPRYGLAAVAVGGRIYALGGLGGMNKNEEYDPATDTWASKPAMPTGRYYLAAAAAAGRIYAVGGSTVTNCGITANEEYDPGTGARFAPLVPNTQHSFKAKARNILGAETAESPVFSTYTLAAVSFPQEVSTFTDVFTSSLTVHWSSGTAAGGYNASGAQYLVQASSVSSFASIAASSLTYNLQAGLEGLAPLTVNKCYYFRVRAANNAGVWGGYLVLGSTMTGAIETPTAIYFDEVSTTAITAAAYAAPPAFTGLDTGLSGINMAIDTNTWTWTGWRNGDVWTVKTAMPTARSSLAAAAAGGRVYAIGGSASPYNQNEEYDPASNSWVSKTAMPTGRYYLAAAASGGRIYALGGYTSPNNQNEEYDPVANTWVSKAVMPTARYSLAAAASGGKIYAIGGYAGGVSAANEEYDPAADSWVAKTAMPTGRSSLAAAAGGGKIYALGGSGGINEAYDPAVDSWASKTAMPTGRSSLAAASVGGRIYAIGGSGVLNTEYDPSADSWTSKAGMPTGRNYLAAAAAGGRIYAIGGTGGTAANEEYDPGTASSFAPLVPNTQYSFKARARNVSGVETAESPVVSTWTLAAVGAAQAAAFTDVFISSLTVNWSSGTVLGGYNGPGAQYLVEASSASSFTAIKASSLTYNLQAGLEGLTPLTVNMCYYFRAKAANNGGVWGDYFVLGSTLCVPIEPPETIYFDEVSTVSITAAAYAAPPAFTDLNIGLSGINVAVGGSYAGWRGGDVWTAKTVMPTGRYGLAASALGGRIYALGGTGGTQKNEEYDPAANTWAVKTAMPTARDGLAASALGGRIYAIGGSGGMQKNEEYDPAADTWASKAAMPTGRYYLAASALGGRIYAIGGFGGTTANEEYDPATNAWAAKTALPTERYGLAAVTFGDRIYAIGGYNVPSSTVVAVNQAYYPATDSWASKTNMPTARQGLAASALGGRIYAVGGHNAVSLNANEEYDPATDAWVAKAAMPTARQYLAASALGGRIYAIGGSGGTNKNEEYDPGRAAKFTGLVPNTQYSFTAKARNAVGFETAESPAFSTYTLAAVAGPQGVSTFAPVFTSSLTVNWSSGTASGGYNGPGAAYLVQASLYSDFISVAGSSQTGNIYAEMTGLAANTSYYFRIKAVNAAGSWGDYIYLSSVSTLAEPVSGAQLYRVFYTSVTLNWLPCPPSPQTAACEGYKVELSTAADFSGQSYSSSTANIGVTTLTVSGLDCGTGYFARAGSLNWDALAAYSVAGSTDTLDWDCGFRFYDAAQTVAGACEYPGVLNSRFRIRGKDGVTYGIILMDPSAPPGKASRFRIQTPSGPKAVRKHQQ